MYYMKCANALTILSRLMPSRGMMRMVSSPAIVPKISCEACVSMSDAIPMAYPGRVLMTARLPENSMFGCPETGLAGCVKVG